MMNTIKWLWAMYRLRRIYHLLAFHARWRFMEEARPFVGDNENRIAWPDAVVWMTGDDVTRAYRSLLPGDWKGFS